MDSPAPNKLERSRSVAQIIAEALDMFQNHPLVFLTLALGVIAPYELILLASTGQGPLASGARESTELAYLILLLDTILIGPLVSALDIHAVVAIGEGRAPRLGAVIARALRALPVVVAAVIVSAFGIGLGFLALIVPGVLLALRWAVVAQVAAIDNEGWLPSLQRSHELTRGKYWHIFGVLIVTGVMSASLGVGVAAIPLGSTSGPVSVAVGIATRTLTASFSALTLALLYFDLRARLAGDRPSPVASSEPTP